jgi:nucleotide-binding universal stress UspA family protein
METVMAIKRVLLPFCGTGDFLPVIRAALTLGRSFNAQVRGLFAQPVEGVAGLPNESMSMERLLHAIEQAGQDRAERLRKTREAFRECSRKFSDVEAAFASSDDGVEGANLSSEARLSDISVLGSGSHCDSNGRREVRDATLFGSGRPILLVPPAGIDQSNFNRVVIAWKDSIEAARALAAAHPFLQLAKDVLLVSVGESDRPSAELQDVAQYVQLHHTAVRIETIPMDPKSVGAALLSKCEALGGALLVMGAYSHWRWQERVFGGVTEHVLHEARTPVLMAH